MSEFCRKGRLTTRQGTRPITFKRIPWLLLVDKDCPFFWSFKIKSQFSSFRWRCRSFGNADLLRGWARLSVCGTLLFGMCVSWDRFCSSWIGHCCVQASTARLTTNSTRDSSWITLPNHCSKSSFLRFFDCPERTRDHWGSRINCPNMFQYHRRKKRFHYI